MKPITQEYRIAAPRAKVFRAFTDEKVIRLWSKDTASFQGRIGGTFSLWGGSIIGKNKKIVKNNLLVQTWRIADEDWKKSSMVTFTFVPEGKQTTVTLVHSGFPEKERRKLALGWRRYYIGAIQNMVVRKKRRVRRT